MKASVSGNVEEARRAYVMRAWADAYERFALADQAASLAIDDLELLAWSATLCGRDDDYLKAGERIYHAYLEAGEDARAARWAFWLCFRLFALEEFGRATGWHARAERLIEPRGGNCVEAGYLLLPLVLRDIGAGNFEGGLQRGTQGDHDRRALCRPRPAGHRAHTAGMRSHEVGADRPGGDIRRRSHVVGSVRRIVAGRDRAHLLHRHRLLP